ncbi:hypothetical protein VKT23_008543 [Stygiomarasmius scandens]|uniref:Glutaminase A central domain-containing protein n=1 Tax=Marasmiellus scandens TaxID=2682957 RepID=A0ABR1JM17_9AGAR
MWSMFAAATLSDNTTRDKLVDSIVETVTSNGVNRAFPLIYDTRNQSRQTLEGSNPQQGAMFAQLARNVNSAEPSTTSAATPPSKLPTSKIIGIAVGSLIAFLVLMLACTLLWRRKKRSALQHATASPFIQEPGYTRSDFSSLNTTNLHNDRKGLTGPIQNAPTLSTRRVKQSYPQTREAPEVASAPMNVAQTQSRDELVTNLMREIEEMRAQRDYEMAPPPRYTVDSQNSEDIR